MRKQLGIIMLFSASIHAVFYMLMYTPHHARMKVPSFNTEDKTLDWSKMIILTGVEEDRDWRTNVYLGAGVIAYFVAVILGVTSLPSVSASLSWKEFRFEKYDHFTRSYLPFQDWFSPS